MKLRMLAVAGDDLMDLDELVDRLDGEKLRICKPLRR